ncbi:MAG: glycosyltransferase family 2 protein, partial [Candidatus Omnitrophica bacterium]|nr:glycosyltransferase family 2 protein [Candidatus Omnitrophota bacterium]
DFVFDNEILLQAFYFGYRIGEISSPSSYTEESSSINFRRSVVYGFNVLATAFKYLLCKYSLAKFPVFDKDGRKIVLSYP